MGCCRRRCVSLWHHKPSLISALRTPRPSALVAEDPLAVTPVGTLLRGTNPNEIVLDLTKTNGTAFAIRYAWSGDCCTDTEVTNKTSAPCPLESCPLMATYPSATGVVKQLPPNPFQAKIVADKCECIAPQVCDA